LGSDRVRRLTAICSDASNGVPLRPLREISVKVAAIQLDGTIVRMLIAFTRAVPPSIDQCELTHLKREPIDYARAVREHAAYEEALQTLGCRVERLPALPDNPDSVFVEDTAVVFDRVAVIARPGAVSRRVEVESAARALAKYRRLSYIEAPATLDGGDVLVTGRVVFVGITGRTSASGAGQLATILAPHGFRIVTVPVTGCLHLKSAVTLLRASRFGGQAGLLLNPAWVDPALFAGFELIEVDPAEPHAANVLAIGDRVICAEAHSGTRRRLEAQGLPTLAVPAAELAKAEGGVTCCSIVFATGT
jgi:dimethylargininase